MLCQFSFGNYKAFKDEALLDLVAEPIREHEQSLIVDKRDKEKFVPVVAIYGPNGGGKSTVLEALNFLRLYLLQTIVLMKVQEKDEKFDSVLKKFSVDLSRDRYHKYAPECENMPTWFDILFRIGGKQFKYQLSLMQNRVYEENLYLQVIGENEVFVIFERTEEECVLGEAVENIAVEKVNASMPLISHIAINYDIDIINEAINWFMNIEVINYDNPRKEWQIKIPKTLEERKKMFEMLRSMDIQIADVRIVKDIDGNVQNVYAKHVLENGMECEIPFEEESSGTRKLFSFLGNCISCLEQGNLLIADELDAKLHPKLLQYIIELFTNAETNSSGAQLLLTSHDITTMTSKVFRRDEIWFCAKNPFGASMLYSLIAFRKENGMQPRNDEAYGKRYLEGHYGADPYIRRIFEWGNLYES